MELLRLLVYYGNYLCNPDATIYNYYASLSILETIYETTHFNSSQLTTVSVMEDYRLKDIAHAFAHRALYTSFHAFNSIPPLHVLTSAETTALEELSTIPNLVTPKLTGTLSTSHQSFQIVSSYLPGRGRKCCEEIMYIVIDRN